jgi:MFS family permease
MKKADFSKYELSFLISLSIAMALRQFVMVLIMPFLALYGNSLKNSTPTLVGISLGIYGLMQGFAQIPMGRMSDRIGRKNGIAIGSVVMIIGLVMAVFARDIYLLVAARAVQGLGAIAAICYSWIGDNISEDRRNRAMSFAGMFMGISATLGFIGGPIAYSLIPVPDIFAACAVLTAISWLYIQLFLKEEQPEKHARLEKVDYRALFRNPVFLKLTLTALIVSFLMISVFFIVPQMLEKSIGAEAMWKIFIPATLFGIVVMRFASRYADKGHFAAVASFSMIAIIIAGAFFIIHNVLLTFFGMLLFMPAYMSMNTMLSASITKLSTKNIRGTVTGVYNTVQFIGSFLGGALSGTLWGINHILPSFAIILAGVAGIILTSKLLADSFVPVTTINLNSVQNVSKE